MSIPTSYEIEHKCGHSDTKDLSEVPAGDRAGRASWLASRPCTACFVKNSDRKLSKEYQAERDALAQAARDDQEQSRLPILTGSTKQADWGTRARYELLRGAYAELVEASDMDDADWDAQILEPARRISRAGWWIDNREATPSMLVELLADPGKIESGIENENPFP